MCHAGLEVNPEGLHFPEIRSTLSSSHLSPPTHFQVYSNLAFPYHLTVTVLMKVTPNHWKNQWALISVHPFYLSVAFSNLIFFFETFSFPIHSDGTYTPSSGLFSIYRGEKWTPIRVQQPMGKSEILQQVLHSTSFISTQTFMENMLYPKSHTRCFKTMECPLLGRKEIGRQVIKTQSKKDRVDRHLDVKTKDN